MNRRRFIQDGGAAAAALVLAGSAAARRAAGGDHITLAVVGVNGQGKSHFRDFSSIGGVRVKTVCDVDERLFPEMLRLAQELTGEGVRFETDIRRVLDDPEIDAISIATPNHWHSLMTVWACQAGKDVYVEKPVSHNVWEGRQAVEAAREYRRVVATGTQGRSHPHVREAVRLLHEGVIGEVYMARGLCFKPRDSIGRRADQPTPPGVDFDLWLGPAPERPFNPHLVHYNWHWFWDFGNGDLGNQGVHQVDIARWGLNKGDLPRFVQSVGGVYAFDTDQETPNTQLSTFRWEDGKTLQFEVRGLYTNHEDDILIGNFFYGSEGWMHLSHNGFRTYLGRGNEPGPSAEADRSGLERILHRQNFIDAVRSGRPEDLAADILEGHLSSAMCHLGNIAYRLNRQLEFDADSERFVGDERADGFLTRDYRPPFVVPEITTGRVPGRRLRFAHFGVGGGIESTLVLVNPWEEAVSGELNFLGSDGSPLSVAMEGAEITAKNEATGVLVRAWTDEGGRFTLPSLHPGRYSFTAFKEGFGPATRVGVRLSVSAVRTLDFELPLGEAAYNVEVCEEMQGLERDFMAAGSVVDRRFVENLPLSGRTFQSLIEMAPGAVLTKAGVTNAGQFSVNGQRSNANLFTVDGVSGNISASIAATFSQQAAGTLPGFGVLGGTNSLVVLDALQEFRIQTSNFAPEFGRAPGAQVTMLTRSGGNTYHGSLTHEWRNERLEANDWFLNASGLDRPPFRLKQFSGTFSGPVSLPGLYDGRNRTFFFLAYEGQRLREPQFRRIQVPTQSARDRAAGPIKALVNAFPLPNASSPFDNPDEGLLEASFSDPSSSNIISLRLDHVASGTLSLFGRVAFAPTSRTFRAFANQETNTFVDNTTMTIGATWVLRPSLIGDVRFNISRSKAGFVWDAAEIGGAVKPPDDILFPAYADRDRASAGFFLGLFRPGIFPPNLTQGRAIGNQQKQVQVVDNWTWATGRHVVKFGADFRFLLPVAEFREYGISYNFGSITRAIDEGLATVSVQALAPRGTMRFPSHSFFIQDTWRATDRTTLTYGLRWEIVPPPRTDRDRPLYRLDRVDNLLEARLAPGGTPLWETRLANFAPRFGFSYLISRSRMLVFRAGAGLFHDLGVGQASRGFNSWPYNTSRVSPNTPFPPPAAALQPIPFNFEPPYSAQFYLTDPHLRQPRTVHWNAGFEKEVPGVGLLDLRYVVNRGRNLLFTEHLRNRPAVPAQGLPATTVLNPDLFTPNATVALTRNLASSDYHSMQLQLRRRVAGGLQSQVSYTWGKALDNFSDEAMPGAPSERVTRDLDRGRADFDVRHNLVVAATYDLPRMQTVLLRGWSLDGIFRTRTAMPVNVVSGSDPLNMGLVTLVRPDVVDGVPRYLYDKNLPGGRRINPDAFLVHSEPRQGNLGRNALQGFNVAQLDLSLRRTFAVTEGVSLEFRASSFNVTNRPNFGDPPGTLQSGGRPSPSFGVSQNMLGRSLSPGTSGLNPLFQIGGPRSMQFSLRLVF